MSPPNVFTHGDAKGVSLARLKLSVDPPWAAGICQISSPPIHTSKCVRPASSFFHRPVGGNIRIWATMCFSSVGDDRSTPSLLVRKFFCWLVSVSSLSSHRNLARGSLNADFVCSKQALSPPPSALEPSGRRLIAEYP